MLNNLLSPDLLNRLSGMADVPPIVAPQQNGGVPPMAPMQHRGLFGLKGTPRDILGILGDALMMSSGMNPLYTPQRQGEKISDALTGLDQNPLDAIAKISAINPALGQKYLEQHQENLRKAEAARTESARYEREYGLKKDQFEFTKDKEGYDRFKDVQPSLFKFIGDATPQTWPMVRQKAMTVAGRYNVALPIDLPEQFDPSISTAYSTFSVNPNTVMQVDSSNQRSQAQLAMSEKRYQETVRSNKVDEAQEDKRITIAETNAENRNNGNSGGGRPRVAGGFQVGSTRSFNGKTWRLERLPSTDPKNWVPIN